MILSLALYPHDSKYLIPLLNPLIISPSERDCRGSSIMAFGAYAYITNKYLFPAID